MLRPIDADGTCNVSKSAALVGAVDPDITIAAHHPTVSVTADSRREIVDLRLMFFHLHRVEP
jgi:hypothetical protein